MCIYTVSPLLLSLERRGRVAHLLENKRGGSPPASSDYELFSSLILTVLLSHSRLASPSVFHTDCSLLQRCPMRLINLRMFLLFNM